ncbi:hypothetical protein RUM44_003481 [Polyplax serrata]|uniref:WD repeat-containing protein 55 homolog n=1 Tax=Polyplax serrata TaxID=468196 RepID=A0ABR1AGQ9_POLSC
MDDSERRKVTELLKEMRGQNEEGGSQTTGEGVRLNWMYKTGPDLINREDYLLGKSIDKSFESLNNAVSNDTCLGRTGEQSNVPKRILERTDNRDQVDIAKKILEDPLYAIKQKELEARKKLLNNPVKLKQIKQMIMERAKMQNAKKKQKKKKRRKEFTMEELDKTIIKLLKKFNEKEKKKALHKVTHFHDSDKISTKDKKNNKLSGKVRKRPSTSSSAFSSSLSSSSSSSSKSSSLSPSTNDSDSESDSSSSERNSKRDRKRRRKLKVQAKQKKKMKVQESSTSDSSEDTQRKIQSKKNDKAKKSKKFKKSSKKVSHSSSSSSSKCTSSTESSSASSDEIEHKDKRHPHRKSKSESKSEQSTSQNNSKRERSRRNNQDKTTDRNLKESNRRNYDRKCSKYDSSDTEKPRKSYGLMMPDGSKPVIGHRETVKKYEKPVETKTKYVPPPKSKPLSKKEQEKKLKEMIRDAKERKKDREKNIADHRKLAAEEEKLETFDEDFVRDDHVLMRWTTHSNESIKICDLPEDLYPTEMHWFPKIMSAGRKPSDLLLITSADGKFHLLHKNGRFEKSVEAHKGAALVGQWSYDGAGILTAGEDGQAKIWSRSGMLRSTIAQEDSPIYAAVWGPDSNQVLLAQGKTLIIKPLTPNTRPTRWKAHDGLILKVAWNQKNNLIVSGGEDCKYKVWDALGRQLYSSAPAEYPITSLAWAPGGEVFVVGSFNTLKLCDKIGWSHSLDKPNSGSIYALSWSLDGTQLAGACSNGSIIFAHILERRIEWKNYEVMQTSRKSITVRDVLTEVADKLEFSGRVAKMALEHNHLIVTTPNQCHIYNTSNWNTPFIFDLKEGPTNLIVLSYKHFALLERSHINIYSYEGKLLCSPKVPGLQIDTIDSTGISLSGDTLAILDQNDDKCIHLLDISSSRQATSLAPVQHVLGVMSAALNQSQGTQERQLAFTDRNRDAYICFVYGHEYRKISKLGVMIQTLSWNPEVNMLAGLQDSTLTIWLYPTALYIDKQLLRKCSIVKDLSEYGRSLTLINFISNQINMRRLDGALISCSVVPYCEVLHGFVASNKWDDARRICRFVNDEMLWACLACMSCHLKNLETAEEAYAAINEFDKVAYIQHIKQLSFGPSQNAHLALLCGNRKEAENIFLLNGLIFRAISVHLDLHNWNRALELALKHRTHVDTVLYARRCYLETFGKSETNEKFLQYEKEVEINPDKIKQKIEMEYAKEKDKSNSVTL